MLPVPAAARGSASAALAALVATAAVDLWRYRVWRLLRGESVPRATAILQRWSRGACAHMGLDVEAYGEVPGRTVVYVANHRSYLDIPVLSGVLGTAFMSRADVAEWTIVGGAARAVGCVFVERDDARGRVRAARALVRRLAIGSVTIFPEGTTTGERLPGPFHEGLFRLLHRLRASVVPVTIRYSHRRAYWIDDIGLARHLRARVLAGGRLSARVHIGAALDPAAHATGADLAAAAHRAVRHPIEELGEIA